MNHDVTVVMLDLPGFSLRFISQSSLLCLHNAQ